MLEMRIYIRISNSASLTISYLAINNYAMNIQAHEQLIMEENK
jgi:hypothetical protein